MGLWDWWWVAYYDYMQRIGVQYPNKELVDRYINLTQSGIFQTIMLRNFCLVVEMPTELHRETPGGRLHSVAGPSIKFADSWELYHLYGVQFEKELHTKLCRYELGAKKILQITNMEQRMAALKFIGAEAILKEVDSKLVHEENGYRLYEVNDLTDQTEYALRYDCPTTAREYVSFVAPEVGKKKDAISAIASKWNMTRQQYLAIHAHS